MVIIERSLEVKNENRKVLWFSVFLLFVLICIFLLTHFLNMYPGGYSLEKHNNEVLIEKGTTIKTVPLKNNELKVAVLESDIIYLKALWYVGVLFTATIVLGVINNFKKR